MANTTVKVSITHHRTGLKAKFSDGVELSYSCSYSGDRMGLKAPVGSPPTDQAMMKKVFKFLQTSLNDEEINGDRLERLAATIRKFSTLPELGASV